MGKQWQGDLTNPATTASNILDAIGYGNVLVPVAADSSKLLDPLVELFSAKWQSFLSRSEELSKSIDCHK